MRSVTGVSECLLQVLGLLQVLLRSVTGLTEVCYMC